MFDLRPYQEILVGHTREAFRANRRVLIVAPTGSGKAVILAYVAYHAAARGNRIILVVHRDELLTQLSGSLSEMSVPHGRIQPGWPRTEEPVQIAMVQTLTRRLHRIINPPDLLFFDEAHHVVSKSYKRIADYWPNARVLGATATPLRLDGRGLGEVFDTMIVGPGTRALIDAGWLADFDYRAPPVDIDMSGVSTVLGDYNVEQLAAATDKPRITGDVIEHYKSYLGGRPAIAFCVRVSHAENVAAAAAAAGIKAVSVDGDTPPAERAARIAGLANGNTELLTSCMIVGEGLDIPAVSGAILLRKTKSLAMYLQWIGRTLRLKRDNSRALILDHVNCVDAHGMPDADRAWTLSGKPPGVAPTATCFRCYRVFRIGAGWKIGQECDDAGEEGCLLNAENGEEPSVVTPPPVVPGTLEVFTRTPAWAGGIDIVLARGAEYKDLMDKANTHERVDMIRKARGYHPGWTRHVMLARQAKRPA